MGGNFIEIICCSYHPMDCVRIGNVLRLRDTSLVIPSGQWSSTSDTFNRFISLTIDHENLLILILWKEPGKLFQSSCKYYHDLNRFWFSYQIVFTTLFTAYRINPFSWHSHRSSSGTGLLAFLWVPRRNRIINMSSQKSTFSSLIFLKSGGY